MIKTTELTDGQKQPLISIVIPLRNDLNKLQDLVENIRMTSNQINIKEIIVVLNGEYDVAEYKTLAGWCTVIYSKTTQRAAAMNLGASVAQGNILYFLHADSILPQGFDELIIESSKNGAGAGCFLLKFDSPSKMLKAFCLFVRLLWYWVHFGDQSLFVDAQVFTRVGGYNENLTTMEDVDIVKRIKKCTHFEVIYKYITTSARKYETNGYFKVQIVYIIVVVLYLMRFPQSVLLRILAQIKK